MIFRFEILPSVFVYRESIFPPDSNFIQSFRLQYARLFNIPWERIKVNFVESVNGHVPILRMEDFLTE